MRTSDKYYKLATEPVPQLDYSAHLNDLIAFRDFLKDRGILTVNTRIERYIQYLKMVATNGQRNELLIFKNSQDERFRTSTDWLLYVLREVHEIMWILRGLRQRVPEGVDAKLKELIGGTDFAALDKNSHSRNIQFELRIASYFCQAGYNVNLATGTDIIALNDDFAFFLECKRVASPSQLCHRFSYALQQLKQKMPLEHMGRKAYGCIVLDVTKVAYSHNGLTFAVTPEHSKDINQDKLKSISKFVANSFDQIGNENLIKCWLQIHISSLIVNPPTLGTRMSSYYLEKMSIGGRSLAALKFLREVDKISSIPDDREDTPKQLVNRNVMTIPAGTVFQPVDMNIVREIIQTGNVTGVSEDFAIGKLEFGKEKHEFFLADLISHFASLSPSEKESFGKLDLQLRFETLLKMYFQRYPFENIS